MLKVILFLATFSLSAYAETEVQPSSSRLSLQIESTNTCRGSVFGSHQPAVEGSDFSSHLHQNHWCQREATRVWWYSNESNVISSEATTWLRLKGQKRQDRMIGLGYRWYLTGDSMAQFRIRKGGEHISISYQTRF